MFLEGCPLHGHRVRRDQGAQGPCGSSWTRPTASTPPAAARPWSTASAACSTLARWCRRSRRWRRWGRTSSSWARGGTAGAAPPPLGLSQAAAAPDGRAGGGEGWRRWWDRWGRRHSRASAPTWASWSCTDTYAGAVESYDADAGYFREGSPAARLHPTQLLLPTPTRGISPTP